MEYTAIDGFGWIIGCLAFVLIARMKLSHQECCVLNSGDGAWAFEPLAVQLSSTLGIEVSVKPRRFNYLLHVENADQPVDYDVFIPPEGIRLASDKRLLAAVFQENDVPTPQTRLFGSFDQVLEFVRSNKDNEWCLKYPTSCGASGHRMVTEASVEPPNWPRPFIVQEFIHLERPEVYRIFCAAGELFGWVVRRFPDGVQLSPWVAHARGARYVRLGEPPYEAVKAARCALIATRLLESFGCVDLLCRTTGEWVVLEVGTDGIFNHVDRDLGNSTLEGDLKKRIAAAFWKAADKSSSNIN